ncbi:MAG: hypothetical protein IIC49_02785 [Planctomycetes bacterium]|nr:hypothetical protein [Planctomycetota bacterium]
MHCDLHGFQVAALLAIACAWPLGCASGGAKNPAADEPLSTGDPEMDRMLAWIQTLDDREAMDLDALAQEAPESGSPALSLAEDSVADAGDTPLAPAGETALAATDPPDPAETDPTTPPDAPPTVFLTDPVPMEGRLAEINVPGALLLLADAPSDDSRPEPAPVPADLADRLADAIRGSTDPAATYRAALALAALAPLIDREWSADPDLGLEASEIAQAVRALLADLTALGVDPDPDDAADAAQRFAQTLADDRPIRITTAALCTRVDGFGRYAELASPPKFLTGQTNRVIVYVEVDRFGHEPVKTDYRGPGPGPAAQWEVRLSQELSLYRASEPTPVWSLPPQTVIEVSRNQRRDFHVTHEIALPANLALGMYQLKVTMRDLVSGAVAEKMITIQIVNDPALISTG